MNQNNRNSKYRTDFFTVYFCQNMAYSLSNRATELIKELKRSDWIPKYNVYACISVFDCFRKMGLILS